VDGVMGRPQRRARRVVHRSASLCSSYAAELSVFRRDRRNWATAAVNSNPVDTVAPVSTIQNRRLHTAHVTAKTALPAPGATARDSGFLRVRGISSPIVWVGQMMMTAVR
jgi:hypothetical protein